MLHIFIFFFLSSFQAAIFLLAFGVNANVGPSGIVSKDGKNIQFSHEFANSIAVMGPSGIVSLTGKNLQLTPDQISLGGPQHIGTFVAQRGLIGDSGIVRFDGKNTQFTQSQVDNFILKGPSGIVTKDGKNIQFTSDLQFANRKKRSVGFVSRAGNVGTSGILRVDGTTDLFDFDTAHNIVLIGPSGIVTRDGKNLQLTSDLHIVGRHKRSLPLVGPSGMILEDGTPVQFKAAGTTILLDGPSGLVLSDGTLVQKKGL